MSIVSFRLSAKMLQEIDAIARMLHIARGEYLRRAIQYMNEKELKKERQERLAQASLKVRKESMKVNAEFSEIEHDPD
jgi:metal-responsive CopG/Arc/MetJ family transcriptional regulator